MKRFRETGNKPGQDSTKIKNIEVSYYLLIANLYLFLNYQFSLTQDDQVDDVTWRDAPVLGLDNISIKKSDEETDVYNNRSNSALDSKTRYYKVNISLN